MLAAVCLALPACEHAQPFGGADLGPNGPFSSAFPRQLTFSDGSDLAPAWLPDGSGIIYSFQPSPDSKPDRCLAILPPEGGHQVQVICHASPAATDSVTALWSPAVGPGGALAFVRESSAPFRLAPASRELVVASLADPEPGRAALSFPYTTAGGAQVGTASDLHWADAHTLFFLAEGVTYLTGSGPADTVLTPIEIERLDLSGDSAAVAPVPGTSGATSLDVVGGDSLYVTFTGDSIVYALGVGGGARSIVHDFGAVGPVTGVRRAAQKLVAIGGLLTYRGLGGDIYVVDLTTGATQKPPYPTGGLFYRHPALGPSGTLVVAEGYVALYTVLEPGVDTSPVDTTVERQAKLWLHQAP